MIQIEGGSARAVQGEGDGTDGVGVKNSSGRALEEVEGRSANVVQMEGGSVNAVEEESCSATVVLGPGGGGAGGLVMGGRTDGR